MNAWKRYCQLVAMEPFRAYFPVGMALGLLGVALWPLHSAGIVRLYPMAAHSRLMAYGFLGCFVFGFLFTAGPRLLKCPRPPAIAVGVFLMATLAGSVLLLQNRVAAADGIFLGQAVLAIALAALGFSRRGDLPPPGFLLGAAGLLAAMAGAVLLLAETLGHATAATYVTGRALLFQAFPALPLIGIGAFFFPKLSGGTNGQDLPENPRITAAWLTRAAWAALVAIIFGISIWAEVQGSVALAHLLRGLSAGAYLWLETPIFRSSAPAGPQRLHLRICAVALVGGFLAAAAFPHQRVGWLHLFFIASVSGSILLVATRVVLGHSGSSHLVKRSAKSLLWGIALLALAAASRAGAELLPTNRTILLTAASLLWILMAVVWLIVIAPKTRIPDPDDNC